MPETQPDLSDKSWEDLYEADYDLVREIASNVEGVRGDGSHVEIAAGLMAADGRADEVPDQYQESVPDEQTERKGETHTVEESSDTDTEAGGDTDGEEADEPDESEGESDDSEEADEPGESDEETEGDEDEFEPASEYVPNRDHSWIIKAKPLQKWLESAKAIVDEARIHLGTASLWMQAVDPANVGMVRTELESTAFESFESPGDGNALIGVNLVRLNDVVSGADADQLVHIEYVGTTRNLIVEVGPHEFTLATIDPDSIRTEPDLPDLDLPCRVEVDGKEYSTAVGYADDVSDHVRVQTDGAGVFSLYAEGDTDSYEGVFEDAEVLSYNPSEETHSLFSLDYVKDMVGAFEDETVEIIHGQEFPLTMRQPIEYDERDVGEIEYMLAPRIQSN